MKIQNKTLKVDVADRDLWFTADPHFMHANVIQFCDRPFKDVHEMNTEMAYRWNDAVQPDDLVIVGGDFCFGGQRHWKYLTESLNGEKVLVRGNHDKSVAGDWARVEDILNILVRDGDAEQRITVCHYPMLSWYQSHRGAWQLFGHVHGQLSSPELSDDGFNLNGKLTPRQIDIGVDVWDYRPVSYWTVKDAIKKQVDAGQHNK